MRTLLFLVVAFKGRLSSAVDVDAENYLREFGYLDAYATNAQISVEAVEDAVKELQRMGGLDQTGRLDARTRSLMRAPRCGVKDKGGGRRRRRSRFPRKWHRHDLTYTVENVPYRIPDMLTVRREIFEAARVWADVSGLSISESASKDADMRLSFKKGAHGDAGVFDGRGRVLAHAFGPGDDLGGDVHFDEDEHWTTALTSSRGETSLRSVAMHEFGHALGMPHSEYLNSIMSPFYNPFSDPSLTYYDIVAIQNMYGPGPDGTVAPTDAPSTTSTTTEPTTTVDLIPDPCDTDVDAVTTIRGEYHLFKGKYFWRVSTHDGRLVMEPRLIESIWSEIRTPIDAVVAVDDEVYFFIGQRYYIYNLHQLKYGPQNISNLGIKDVEKVDAAYQWKYYKDEPPIYFWTGSNYWKYDKHKHAVEPSYPRGVHTNWGGIPTPISAAFSIDNVLYFTHGKTAYKFSDFKMRVDEEVPLRSLWRFCPTAESLKSASSLSKPSLLLLFFSILAR